MHCGTDRSKGKSVAEDAYGIAYAEVGSSELVTVRDPGNSQVTESTQGIDWYCQCLNLWSTPLPEPWERKLADASINDADQVPHLG